MRYYGELREPLVWRQGSQVSMCVARGHRCAFRALQDYSVKTQGMDLDAI